MLKSDVHIYIGGHDQINFNILVINELKTMVINFSIEKKTKDSNVEKIIIFSKFKLQKKFP